jgi:hypothetical protein
MRVLLSGLSLLYGEQLTNSFQHLSMSHPSLSTSVMRRFFPDDLPRYKMNNVIVIPAVAL